MQIVSLASSKAAWIWMIKIGSLRLKKFAFIRSVTYSGNVAINGDPFVVAWGLVEEAVSLAIDGCCAVFLSRIWCGRIWICVLCFMYHMVYDHQQQVENGQLLGGREWRLEVSHWTAGKKRPFIVSLSLTLFGNVQHDVCFGCVVHAWVQYGLSCDA